MADIGADIVGPIIRGAIQHVAHPVDVAPRDRDVNEPALLAAILRNMRERPVVEPVIQPVNQPVNQPVIQQPQQTMKDLDKLIDTEIYYLSFKTFETKLFSFRETLTNDMIAYLNGLNQPGIDNDISEKIDENIAKLNGTHNIVNLRALPSSQFFWKVLLTVN